MKSPRYIFAAAIALACFLTCAAKADDFQMVVVDPTVPLDVIQPILTDNFSVTFPTSGPAAGCQASQLAGVLDPGDYSACFTGINLTGAPLTDLEIEFPVFDFGGNVDDPSCPVVSTDEFPDIISCGFTNSDQDYLIEFGGGDIPTATFSNSFCYLNPFASGYVDCNSPAIFTIAVGIPGAVLTPQEIDQDFNTDTTAAADVVLSPEPSSILLMSTGMLSLGLFGAYRRRSLVPIRRG